MMLNAPDVGNRDPGNCFHLDKEISWRYSGVFTFSLLIFLQSEKKPVKAGFIVVGNLEISNLLTDYYLLVELYTFIH